MDGPLAKDERPERERGDMNIDIVFLFDNDEAKINIKIKSIYSLPYSVFQFCTMRNSYGSIFFNKVT